jgi:predicted nucleotidyltransferase
MDTESLIRRLTQATPEFEMLDWLEEVVLFGPALAEEPVDDDVDLLLVARRTLSTEEMKDARNRLQEVLEERVQQSIALRISTSHALETPRSRGVGTARIFKHQTVSIFRRGE